MQAFRQEYVLKEASLLLLIILLQVGNRHVVEACGGDATCLF